MAKFFRKIRFSFLSEGKLLNYMKYAVGEIILVVIGILIAVSLNNLNEKRKQKNLYSTILTIIEDDMISDSITIHAPLKGFNTIDSIYNKILSGKMTLEDYVACEQCVNIINTHSPFTYKTKGYDLLKGYVDIQKNVKDSLVTDILLFYAQITELNKIINDYNKQDVIENLKNWKENHNWFHLEHTERIKDKDFTNYILESPDFKNRVFIQKTLVIKNLKNNMLLFNSNAKILLPLIQQKVAENHLINPFSAHHISLFDVSSLGVSSLFKMCVLASYFPLRSSILLFFHI